MSLLNLHLDDVPDEVTVEPGEHQLVVTKATERDSAAGAPMIEVFFNVIENPDAKMIAHYFMLPEKGNKNNNNRLRSLKSFCLACGIDLAQPINVEEDFKGKEVYAILKLEDSDEYGTSNRISRFVIPSK